VQKYGAIAISVMIVLSFGTILGIWLLRPTSVQGASSEVLNILLGTLAAGFTQVCNYWLGSSSGSKHKDEALAVLSASKN
jgi:hypothetical protein